MYLGDINLEANKALPPHLERDVPRRLTRQPYTSQRLNNVALYCVHISDLSAIKYLYIIIDIVFDYM